MSNWLTKELPAAATFSKGPAAWGLPETTQVEWACGAKITLDELRSMWHVDWTSTLGANLLGQGMDSMGMDFVLSAQASGGWAFTLPYLLEAEAAHKLALLLGGSVPGWATNDVGVRWCGTGTDAVAMAVRLARAVTGREWVLTFKNSYHGWAEWTVARTEPAAGIVRGDSTNAWMHAKVIDQEWGNVELLEVAMKRLGLAAVVFEHPPWDPPDGWWDSVRKLCDEHGVLLVADEVVTGLRCGPGGACGLWGIEPDLVCMGKALGNGLPVAALAGRWELMDRFAGTEPVFCSSTSWGNALSLAAADHVLGLWLKRGEELAARLWFLGGKLIEGLREAGWTVEGHPPRSVLQFESLVETKFFISEMMAHGHLFNRPNFPNLAMSAGDVADAVEAARAVREKYEFIGADEVGRMYGDELPRRLFSGR